MNNIEKMSRSSFDEKFEIIFGEAQTLFSGTSKVLCNQKQAFLKNKMTAEIIPTDIYSTSEELGELLVIEQLCDLQVD